MTTPDNASPTPDSPIPKHWSREPWVYFLFGIPALTVVAGVATLIIAINHPAQTIAQSTTDTKKQAYRALIARERQISAQLGFTAEGYLHAAFTSKVPMADASISVLLYQLTAEPITQAKPAELSPSNLSRRHFGSTMMLSLELAKQNDGSYRSTQSLTASQRTMDYWMEVIGERAAWSLSGILPQNGLAILQPE